MYYSSTLFALVGFSNPVAVGLVVAGTNFVMTWVNMMTVDPIGRRRVLVSTVWGMSAGLLAVAIAFSFIPVNTDTLELEATTVSSAAIVVLVFIIWFVFFYGVSVGNTAWMSTDFFPMEVRPPRPPPFFSSCFLRPRKFPRADCTPQRFVPWAPCGSHAPAGVATSSCPRPSCR